MPIWHLASVLFTRCVRKFNCKYVYIDKCQWETFHKYCPVLLNLLWTNQDRKMIPHSFGELPVANMQFSFHIIATVYFRGVVSLYLFPNWWKCSTWRKATSHRSFQLNHSLQKMAVILNIELEYFLEDMLNLHQLFHQALRLEIHRQFWHGSILKSNEHNSASTYSTCMIFYLPHEYSNVSILHNFKRGKKEWMRTQENALK